jgi:hypothetical protein
MKSHLKLYQSFQAFTLDQRPSYQHHVVGASLFEQFSIDYIGPFPETSHGNKYILLCVENFTRWPIACVSKDNEAITTAKFMYSDLFCQFGLPTHLLSDNGAHFLNNVVSQFLTIIKTNHKTTSSYYPECNGMAEKTNGIIVGSLKRMVHENCRICGIIEPE